MNVFRLVPLVAASLISSLACGDEISIAGKKDEPTTEAAAVGDDAQAALKKFAVAPGLQVEVWASEPLLANPVALSFDDRGRAFVAETYRRRSSVPDIRRHEDWTLENLKLRSVEERVAFLKGKYPEKGSRPAIKDVPDFNGDGRIDWRDLEVESERVKVIEDANGDGRADQSHVLAADFATLATGAGAGVCAHGGEIFYTCAPDLWKIRADGTKEKLLSGFGVHVVYSGHDMHGPKIGPDGRLYFSIADCGARVTGKEGQIIDNPDSGAIFRCELDGSKLELVAKGLRNPQSLAWNEVGDLFTGDNNADGGDKARWIHVVEGADYGWRLGWQFLPKLGAWNSEGLWHLDSAEKNRAILPPVGHIGHGPAGIAYYPGTGLPAAYADHFFMADFPGGMRAFQLVPKGASYTVENAGDFLQDNSPQKLTGKALWGLYPSDVAFAPGGGLYVLDWIQGWEKTGKGRIFRVFDPATDASAVVAETKRVLAEGMAQSGDEELIKFLGHADQRVRFAAQFEVMRRGKRPGGDQVACMDLTMDPKTPRLALLHAIWALTATRSANGNLLKHDDPIIRAATAQAIGENRDHHFDGDLVSLLEDPSSRVRFFAAQSLGKLGVKKAAPALFALLKSADNKDAYLRHAAVVALAANADAETFAGKAADPSEAIRTGSLLALRRQASPEVAAFLADGNAALRLEAARAIHDEPIKAAWPALAAVADAAELAEPAWRRAVNANYLLGTAEAAERLGQLAVNTATTTARRLFALESLTVWNAPFGRDRITGLWRDLPPRAEAKGAREVAARIAPALLVKRDESIQLATAEMAGALRTNEAEPALLALVGDAAASGKVRAAALRAIAAMNSPKLADAVRAALANSDPTLLEAARRLAAKTSPELAVQVNAAVLGKGTPREQQEALATIAAQTIPEADRALSAQLDQLAAGQLSPALQLDLLEAVANRTDAALQQKLAAYEAARPSADPLAKWRECLNGGDAKLGREIFYEKAEAACLRCHKVKGEGGDVGPDMAGIGKRQDRERLLRAIIEPNAEIAPGYENVLLTLTDQNMVVGLLKTEDATNVTIASLTDGKTTVVPKASIKERTRVPSPMPPGLGEVLGKRGLRDLVEYLASLK